MLTEERNPKSQHIDDMTTFEMVSLINEEDKSVALAVEKVLPQIVRAVDGIRDRLEHGGRLFYVGAGTSGRLGVLDAAECPPTFGVDPTLVQGILAGGRRAGSAALEFLEDDDHQGQEDLKACGLTVDDAVVGITASGRTPYTLGALRFARHLGALTVSISNNPYSEISQHAEVAIEVLTGPEVVTGSTRLKAGTAQKMILNMLSTAVLIHLGNVYGNMMVNVKLSNKKLVQRGIRIIAEATGVTVKKAESALHKAGDVRSAIVMIKLDCTPDEARGLVSQSARLNQILREER